MQSCSLWIIICLCILHRFELHQDKLKSWYFAIQFKICPYFALYYVIFHNEDLDDLLVSKAKFREILECSFAIKSKVPMLPFLKSCIVTHQPHLLNQSKNAEDSYHECIQCTNKANGNVYITKNVSAVIRNKECPIKQSRMAYSGQSQVSTIKTGKN